MQILEILRLAVEAVAAKKALEPIVLDMIELTPIFDYFLICSGQSQVQVKAIADNLQEEMDRAGMAILRKEGGHEGHWILLDYGWLVVHVMLQGEREFYQLERLWHDAERLDLLPPEAGAPPAGPH